MEDKETDKFAGKKLNPINDVDKAIVLSIKLAGQIRKQIGSWKYFDKGILGEQLFKSAISVASNLAEGKQRSFNQKSNFLYIVLGSANEAIAQIRIAQACGFIHPRSSKRYRFQYLRIVDFIKEESKKNRQERDMNREIEEQDMDITEEDDVPF